MHGANAAIKQNRIKKIIIAAAIITTLCAAGTFVVLYGPVAYLLMRRSAPQIIFDAEKWKNTELYLNDNTRYKMIEDLLKKHQLVGMNKEEIISLLGPESDPDYFKDWDLRYWLGHEQGLGVDSLWLLFKLKNGKVSEYKITKD